MVNDWQVKVNLDSFLHRHQHHIIPHPHKTHPPDSSMAAAAAAAATSSLFSLFNTPPPKSPPSLSLSSTSKDRWAPLHSSNEQVMAVVSPSLAHANLLMFRSGYNVQVIVDDNEPEERLLGRFRREVMRAGVIQECKRRRFFENKQEEKKRKAREAAKRNRRRRPQMRSAGPERTEGAKKKGEEEDTDNWDIPPGGIP